VPLVPAAIAGTDRLLALRRWRIAFARAVPLDGLPEDARSAARVATERLWEAVTSLELSLAAPARRLRPRLLLDISLRDLLFALGVCLTPNPGSEARVLEAWGADGQCMTGTRGDLAPLAAVAGRHRLLLVEDCAQSFRGPTAARNSLADVSLYSFGAIKTATALAGAIACVRRPDVARRMRELEDRRPKQPRMEYAARVCRFAALVVIGRPRAYYAFEQLLRLRGKDLDEVVVASVRGFRADLIQRIRRRPCAPLLALVERRLRRFDNERLARRTCVAERLGRRASRGPRTALDARARRDRLGVPGPDGRCRRAAR
jgi:hypothetical protein